MYDFAFKQIRESLHGKVKILISGSAPISPVQTPHFMRVYEWAKENGVKADMKTLAESNELKEIILF